MKNFEDFSKTIPPSEIGTIVNKSTIRLINDNTGKEKPQNEAERNLKLQTELPFYITMELLSRYHEWINED